MRSLVPADTDADVSLLEPGGSGCERSSPLELDGPISQEGRLTDSGTPTSRLQLWESHCSARPDRQFMDLVKHTPQPQALHLNQPCLVISVITKTFICCGDAYCIMMECVTVTCDYLAGLMCLGHGANSRAQSFNNFEVILFILLILLQYV